MTGLRTDKSFINKKLHGCSMRSSVRKGRCLALGSRIFALETETLRISSSPSSNSAKKNGSTDPININKTDEIKLVCRERIKFGKDIMIRAKMLVIMKCQKMYEISYF